MTAPIILVPGFWLGAWAWDEVAELLRSEGHDVTALTLPGLESVDTDRSNITLTDQVDAIVESIEASPVPVVLAVHSGASNPGYAATDRLPERIAAMVYVDTAPGNGSMDPDFAGVEMPIPSLEVLAKNENLTGLSDEQLETFQRRGVPEPGGVVREAAVLTNDARLDVPTFLIATGFSSDDYKKYAQQGYPWLSGLNELHDLTYIDLPTSHWPMWSRPKDLAKILATIASA